jgi:hypothetical protein
MKTLVPIFGVLRSVVHKVGPRASVSNRDDACVSAAKSNVLQEKYQHDSQHIDGYAAMTTGHKDRSNLAFWLL